MKESITKKLIIVGWASFLLAVAFIIVGWWIGLFPDGDGNLLLLVSMIAGVIIAVAAMLVSIEASNRVELKWKSWTTVVIGGICCPLLLVTVIVSMFVYIPAEGSGTLVQYTEYTLEVRTVTATTFHNPFKQKIVRYNLYGTVSYEGVWLEFRYSGDVLNFHYWYHNDPDLYRRWADSTMIRIMRAVADSSAGCTRLQYINNLQAALAAWEHPVELEYTGRFGLTGLSYLCDTISVAEEK